MRSLRVLVRRSFTSSASPSSPASAASIPYIVPRESFIRLRQGTPQLSVTERQFVWQWAGATLNEFGQMSEDDARLIVELLGRVLQAASDAGALSAENAELIALLRLVFQYHNWHVIVSKNSDAEDSFELFSFRSKTDETQLILGALSKPQYLTQIQDHNVGMPLTTRAVTGLDLFRIMIEGQFTSLSLDPGVSGSYIMIPFNTHQVQRFVRLAVCAAACFPVLADEQGLSLELYDMLRAEETTCFQVGWYNEDTSAVALIRHGEGGPPVVLSSLDQIALMTENTSVAGKNITPVGRVLSGQDVIDMMRKDGVTIGAVGKRLYQLKGSDWDNIEAIVKNNKSKAAAEEEAEEAEEEDAEEAEAVAEQEEENKAKSKQ